ncbi:DUF4185 domain-containing protein [Tautonia plasticadhaerens]|uniref:Uncharacterized protein n=1 Tax=Tautonia plasticadhaerens TaxID=2527974 RepID=A0A518HCJ3_9BACT|nr:DUF4185 domain-containing protein [Tautonia plasticadhaerens]QDV38583.1 hypothetical protein ElP_65380 [Tautonia plasticadhaerens]
MSHAALIPSLLFLIAPAPPAVQRGEPFAVEVVDAETGRGVPMVELRTVHNLRYDTDSAGLAAIDAPELMGQEVYFHVSSHGYEYPADGFGYRGVRLRVEPGGAARLELPRVNVAERLYRVTGGGIYADTVRLGREAPIEEPLMAGKVFGQDSVFTVPYRGKLWWFWGDTSRPAYPLGNFHMSGATSGLPSEGGLDPGIGIDLDYFVDENGFSREMARMPGDGPTWLSGFVVLPDAEGSDRLYAGYAKIKPPLETYERGLCVFDDEAGRFERVDAFPGLDTLHPDGHAFRVGDEPWVYFATPYPLVRVPADPGAMADPSRYQAFTCLESDGDGPRVERDAGGRPVYRWRDGATALGPKRQAELIEAGTLGEGEGLLNLRDIETGEPVFAHAGTVNRNEHRGRWVMITTQLFGSSSLGEVWYAEADSPLGPWAFARKVVTHDDYSFYNPKHHHLFDADGGRRIYFEGTYTHTFSGTRTPTPRYDYNQIMYRLDLDDPRLNLPVAVYRMGDARLRPGPDGRPAEQSIAFFALDREAEGTVPIAERLVGDQGMIRIGGPDDPEPIFHALPADLADPPPGTAPLFEYRHDSGHVHYATEGDEPGEGYRRVGGPICRVWRRPGPERQPLFP